MMGNLANYFDYEAFARELFNRDYTMGANGHVFRRIWPLHPLCIKGFSERRGSFCIILELSNVLYSYLLPVSTYWLLVISLYHAQ